MIGRAPVQTLRIYPTPSDHATSLPRQYARRRIRTATTPAVWWTGSNAHASLVNTLTTPALIPQTTKNTPLKPPPPTPDNTPHTTPFTPSLTPPLSPSPTPPTPFSFSPTPTPSFNHVL